MGKVVRISTEAESEILEIATSRATFDRVAGLRFPRSVLRGVRDVAAGRVLHRIVREHLGESIRAMVVEGCVVLYVANKEYVDVLRVFAAGRDWHNELEEEEP